MKLYQVVFSFLDPSRAMGTIAANSPEEAIEKIKRDIEENSPGIQDLQILEIQELLDSPLVDDPDAERTSH